MPFKGLLQPTVVVDLKTGGSAPREDELARHPQLAVLLGAFEQSDDFMRGPPAPGEIHHTVA